MARKGTCRHSQGDIGGKQRTVLTVNFVSVSQRVKGLHTRLLTKAIAIMTHII